MLSFSSLAVRSATISRASGRERASRSSLLTARVSPARQAASASRSPGRVRLVPVNPWSTYMCSSLTPRARSASFWAVRSCSLVETRAYPMMSPGMVSTVAFEAPSPGRFAGGAYGNLTFAECRIF